MQQRFWRVFPAKHANHAGCNAVFLRKKRHKRIRMCRSFFSKIHEENFSFSESQIEFRAQNHLTGAASVVQFGRLPILASRSRRFKRV